MTPFGRQPVTAGLLATHALAEAPAPAENPDKWAILRDLTVARRGFGISDRDLVVLAALLSFYPSPKLADDASLIVFPSNASLSERAHGMAESTLRRHLAALVKAGLILRRDSPNGKRFARRNLSGGLDRVFGFDLRPLLVSAPRIAACAHEARQAQYAHRALRETVVIGLRDLTKLILWGMESVAMDWTELQTSCAEMQRGLRRKLTVEGLQAMAKRIRALTDEVSRYIHPSAPVETAEMSANARETERHYHNSNKEIKESEPCDEKQGVTASEPPPIPLGLVLKAAPNVRDYAPDGIASWRDLVTAANVIRPMMGITIDAWQRACGSMGPEAAAVTLACMLQRSEAIVKPGGYLRNLTQKAEGSGFSPGPMVMALIRAENARAA